jgi:4-hydroxy-tetrahydrodipicolinate reductase
MQTNITIIGYGKMGQLIAEIITKNPNLKINSIISLSNPNATHKQIDAQNIANSDVIIEFTSPTQAAANFKTILKYKPDAKIVSGTTGWDEQLPYVKDLILKNPKSAFLHSSNFSIGVQLFWRVIRFAAEQFNQYNDMFDVFGHEFHHNQKADSPGGTAKNTAEILLEKFDTKTEIQYDTSYQKIKPEQLHFTSTRGGSVPGTHSAFFDSFADTIEITHTARSRHGFAEGAVQTALWLKDQTGFFTIQDYLNKNNLTNLHD